MSTVMQGVREYAEDYAVEIDVSGGYYVGRENNQPVFRDAGRLVVRAFNECRHNQTEVDLLDLIAWLKANRPELLA